MRGRCGLLFLLLSVLGPAAAAQPRTITGTVTDSVSGAAVTGATLTVRGTTIVATAGEGGRFTLTGVPAGAARATVRRIGYRPREVILPAGDEELRVMLVPDLLQLAEVVVTGQATTLDRRNLPNAVATLSAEEVQAVPAQSVEHALQGKVAGAVISGNSGAPGGGVQVRMRGVTSINAQSDPLYVVDGVLLSNVAIPSNQNAVTGAASGSNPSLDQDGQVNRIADLNPNDVERVEILKGASASAIYGSRASNGVVIITTRRGRTGRPELRLAQRVGFFQLSNTLGARRFATAAEAVDVWGEEASEFFQPGVAFDHERELAGRTRPSYETVFDVSGGSEATRYFLSGTWHDDAGIIENTGFERQGVRLNLDHAFGDRVNLSVGTNALRTQASRGLTNNDNLSVSFYMALPFTPSFVDLRRQATGSFPENPFVASNPLQTAALMQNDETVWRYVGSARLSVDALTTPRQSLRFVANAGADYFTQKNDLLFPPELQFEPDDGEPGTSLFTNSDNLSVNVGASGIHRYTTAGGRASATTSFGTTFATRDLDIARVVSRNLVGGLEILNAGTNVQVLEQRQRVEDFGFFLQEEVLLGDRLLLTAGINADRSSVNTDDEKLYAYPKVAGSYVWETPVGWLDQLKLRAAYGESGNQPLYGQKFTPLIATQNITALPGLVVEGTVAANDLHPERQREIEGGLDATLFGSRGTLELTVFQKNVRDLLLERTLAPSSGFETEIFNGGRLRTRGVEVAVGVVPVATQDVQWLLRSTFFRSRSTIVDLPVPTFRAGGFGTALGAFQIEEGASATQIVGNDSLPDGSTIVRKIGDATPDFTMSLSNELSFRRFRLYGLLDWQQGGDIINLTKFLYDLGQNSADYADPITVGGEETTVGAQRLAVFGKQTAVYVEDASFVKLREVTLSYDLPEALLARVWGSARSARLSLSGRNLLTFTDYTGLDPEVSNFGNQNVARNIDVAPFPPSRSFWFGVDIGF